MNMTNAEYDAFIRRHMPRSPLWTDLIKAFVIGGLICCLGQGFSLLYGELLGLDEETAAAGVSMTLIALSAFFTGLNLYDRLARFAGAGTLVPITGFANAVVSPALEFKSEGFVLGTAAKMFTIAGPVIVFGVGASVVYGLILCLLP